MKTTILVIGILLISGISSFTLADETTQSRTIYVDDDNISGPWDGTMVYPFNLIQDGINASSNSDMVFVYNGLYIENIKIGSSINLVGESKEDTVIDGNGNGDVIYVSVDGVSISGFTIQNGGLEGDWYDPDSGIDILSSFNEIYDNLIESVGIGISLRNSENNVINNIIQNNGHGVFVYHGGGTIIRNNRIFDIQGNMFGMNAMGIYIAKTNNCDIIGNNIENNKWGIHTWDSSNINILENYIISNSRSLKIGEGSDIIISNNHIENSSIEVGHGVDHCYTTAFQNNILNSYVFLIGGSVYFDNGYISVKKSESTWDNNYWGGIHLFIKIISPIQKHMFGFEFYLDADLNPAHRSFDIPN
ncbi:MAG: hypothetical protein DRN27_05870 [Thermoplasmata archaeon]|nr:MAG: hypothetical protein DRN27_05870 [Thermoplasmata archaeon]